MDLYLLLLRIVHIFSGVFWVGAVAVLVLFLQPTSAALGSEAQKFMQHITFRRRLPDVVLGAAALNIIAGLLLYWRISGGLQIAWITTRPGLAFTAGALASLMAIGIGMSVTRPAILRLGALGAQIQSAGKPPAPEQLAEVQRVQRVTVQGARWVLGLLVIALLAMATARYL